MRFRILFGSLLLSACQFVILESHKLPNFYPFGANEGDTIVPPNDDGSSREVKISVPFPFFDQNHKSLFVSIYSFVVACIDRKYYKLLAGSHYIYILMVLCFERLTNNEQGNIYNRSYFKSSFTPM